VKRHIILLAALANLARAQSFDVVSIKPLAPGATDRFDSYCAGGGRFITRGTPLLWSIKWAYGIKDYQLSEGWPAWLNAFSSYNIEAQNDAKVTEAQCRAMVRTLFEERFKLSLRRQTRTVSAFALIVGKNGSKLSAPGLVKINGSVKQSSDEREPPQGWTMTRLANYIANLKAVGQPVLDRTGLTGSYGLSLDYATSENDHDRPDIFTALQQQLGLKLQSIKALVEMFVVDHVERPSPN
jgi:uncharacterized protein (TIGR03435 family)